MKMNDIKKQFGILFHSLTNRQNRVSVKAGLIVALADRKNYASLSKEELLNEVPRMIEDLRLIGKAPREPGECADNLDDTVKPLGNAEKPDYLNELLQSPG